VSSQKNSEIAVEQNPFVEFVKRYKTNPVLFVREVLNTKPDEWQIEFLTHIASGNRRISVRSGHGVGKSTAAAWAMIWYLFLRFPVKIVVTAPTSSQLYVYFGQDKPRRAARGAARRAQRERDAGG